MNIDLTGRNVLLGVTGGVAAYKAAELASRCVQSGAVVTTVMTESALRFVQPLTFEALTRRPVYTSLWGPRAGGVEGVEESRHISLADLAEVLVIAPATANVIGKMANGLADDLLTCIAMATRAPIVLAPAMNDHMYTHPATQRNIALLAENGCRFVGPEEGRLANGKIGTGRLAATDDILKAIEDAYDASRRAR